MEVITIANRKGGATKTATCYAIAAGLQKKGFKVLAIDMDSQHNLTTGTTAKPTSSTIYEVLTGKATAQEAIQHLNSFDIIPANDSLGAADTVIVQTGKEYRLKEALESLQSKYDYCIIDTPSALSICTVNAFTASNGVIIPARAEEDSKQGIELIYPIIQTVKKYCNAAVEIYGIVITAYDHRTTLSKDMRENIAALAKSLDIPVYKTVIRSNVSIGEAKAMKQSIYDYAPRSNGAEDYGMLIAEILKSTSQ